MGADFTKRIIVDALIFLSIFIWPWWLSVSLILTSFFIFDFFYEGLLFGLMVDLIYSVSRDLFYNLPLIFILCVVFFWLVVLLNKQLRLKNK